ncbi:hypothetical protein [Streptomyces sp. NPDC058145]|uniref:hypothetical protein n=1 Tax=Streptomyces sp. NPDC058145 TaxID=3346356 RepID=UPI0036F0A6C1
MDFFLGEVTRDHGDVDWFAWARGAAALTGALTRPGHRPVPGPPPGLRLDFTKDGLVQQFPPAGQGRRGPDRRRGRPLGRDALARGAAR